MVKGIEIALMRKSLGKTVEMKVGDENITGNWHDIQLNTRTGLISGIYVGGRLYRLDEIGYIKVK